MDQLTPYDRGSRLEPHAWVRGDTASPGGLPRRAVEADYGRVDFDSDDGTTILTLYVGRGDNGYELVIDQHSDAYLHVVGANEPPVLPGPGAELDPEYRARQMMLLDAGIEQIGNDFGGHLSIQHGDPLTFSQGHYVLFPTEVIGAWFAIEELHAKGTDWADPDRVPIGWAWRETGPVRLPNGQWDPRVVAEGTTIPSDIDSLTTRIRDWAQALARHAAPDDFDRSISYPHLHRDDPSRSAPGAGEAPHLNGDSYTASGRDTARGSL